MPALECRPEKPNFIHKGPVWKQVLIPTKQEHPQFHSISCFVFRQLVSCIRDVLGIVVKKTCRHQSFVDESGHPRSRQTILLLNMQYW